MKKKSLPVASPETFCGEFGIIILRRPKKIDARVHHFDLTGASQTDVALDGFTKLEQCERGVVRFQNFLQLFLQTIQFFRVFRLRKIFLIAAENNTILKKIDLFVSETRGCRNPKQKRVKTAAPESFGRRGKAVLKIKVNGDRRAGGKINYQCVGNLHQLKTRSTDVPVGGGAQNRFSDSARRRQTRANRKTAEQIHRKVRSVNLAKRERLNFDFADCQAREIKP